MNLSDKYDKFYESSLEAERLDTISLGSWPKNRMEAIVYAGGSGERVLDIGCGNGYLLYQFRNKFNTLIGLEFSRQRLSQAEINLADCNFSPIEGSAESMAQITSGSIDHIISADTIEHIPDIYRALAEMFRVLRPGGTIVINTPNIAFIKKRLLLCLGRFPSTSQPNEGLGSDILFDGGHLHYLTFRSLRLLLMKAGFVVEKKIGYGKFGYLHNVWPELFSGGVQWLARKP